MVLGGPRCGVHLATLNKVGPNQIRREELNYVHIMNIATIRRNIPVNDEEDHIMRGIRAALREENIRYQIAVNELENVINRETDENNGVNADQVIIDRARERRRIMIEQRRNRRIQIHEWVRQRQPIQPQVDAPIMGGDLANLANDRQNIHTALVVQKVKETVEKVLQILVPPEYQTDTLKTPGEIILECNLSKKAAWQMMAKYCNDDDIYEMGAGIYARVLNSVWQYIKASPDAGDLKKILASEMEDNIGMCAQGNLSRLCNILSGYIEGINANIKSRNEILGERFAELLILNEGREEAGRAILEELNIPLHEWNNWLDAL